MLLVHILFVLFSIDLSPPIRTSRVPSSTPGTSILEVDEAGNQIEIAANGLVFTHLTVPEAEATFANANTTPPDMHPNVSSASAAPEGSVASQVSAILDPLQGDAEEMSKAERGANMLTQRNLPETQAAMIELRQKHESAETLLRASISEAETQKQQNASEAMGAKYLAKNAGLEANSKPAVPTALKQALVAGNVADAVFDSEDFWDFLSRMEHAEADAEMVTQALMGAAQGGNVTFTKADVQQAMRINEAVEDIQAEFGITEKEARIALRAGWPGWKMMPVGEALDLAKRRIGESIRKQKEEREEESKKAAKLRGKWREYCLKKAREEFGDTLDGEWLPPGKGADYLSWKINMIFQTPDLPDYSKDVSDAIRHFVDKPKVQDRPRLNPVPTIKDIS